MLNFGARRLRASRLAGKTEIPAFVDKAATGYDQVIENEQREGLKPLELALFVQKRLAEGESQADIARRLGKGRAYITYATALIDAPDWLMSLYRAGRCRGARELHELRRLQEVHPDCVRDLQSESGPVTRERVASLKASFAKGCDNAPPEHAELDAPRSRNAEAEGEEERAPRQAVDPKSRPAPIRAKPAIAPKPLSTVQGARTAGPKLLARLDDTIVEIVTNAVPPEAGHIFVATPAAVVQAVEVGRLQLLRIVAR